MKKILLFVLLITCFSLFSCDYIDQRNRKKEIQDSIKMFNDSIEGLKASVEKIKSENPKYDFNNNNEYDSLQHKEWELYRELEYHVKWYYSYYRKNDHEYFIDNQSGKRIDEIGYDICEDCHARNNSF